jgi:hypothetical protein
MGRDVRTKVLLSGPRRERTTVAFLATACQSRAKTWETPLFRHEQAGLCAHWPRLFFNIKTDHDGGSAGESDAPAGMQTAQIAG